MTDWNPAEMIGQSPSNLSYSLYSKLITNSSWLKARKIMGYKSNFDNNLMHKIAGKPFIDIRKSMSFMNPIAHSFSIIRRLPFLKAGGYDPKLVIAHDYDLWIRLLEGRKPAI